MTYSPAVTFQPYLVFCIRVDEVQGEFQRLARVAREVEKPEKRDPLRVLAQERVSVLGHFQKVAGHPAGDCRERLRPRAGNHRPAIETHRRPDVDPGQAAIGEASLRRPDGLTGGEVMIVRRDGELS